MGRYSSEGGAYLRSRTRCYGPTSHRREEREVKLGKGFTAKVRNMSSGTCTCEEEANSVCAPKLNDQRGAQADKHLVGAHIHYA